MTKDLMIGLRKISCGLLLTLGCLLLCSGVASASSTVVINGNPLALDTPTVIQNGRLLVPMRNIFQALGATVNWDSSTQTVTATRGLTSISLVIGSTDASVNGSTVTLDVPPEIINGYTFVPIRFVGEALGCQVNWDGGSQSVTISSSGKNQSSPLTANITTSLNQIYHDENGNFDFLVPDGWVTFENPNLNQSDPLLNVVRAESPDGNAMIQFNAITLIGTTPYTSDDALAKFDDGTLNLFTNWNETNRQETTLQDGDSAWFIFGTGTLAGITGKAIEEIDVTSNHIIANSAIIGPAYNTESNIATVLQVLSSISF
jgi:hypothetical protein